jgi:hypothetical protein
MKALQVTDPEKTLQKLKNQHGNVESGATDMLLSQPTYATWKQGGAKDNNVLWIHARAGAGLTDVLLRLSDDLQALADASKDKSVVLAHFFCYDENQSSAAHLVRSLMYQLIEQQPDLALVLLRAGYGQAQVSGRGKAAGDGPPLDTLPLAMLLGYLRDMLKDGKLETIYFVVGALEQLEQDSRAEFLQFLQDYIGAPAVDDAAAPNAADAARNGEPGTVKWALLSAFDRKDITQSLRRAACIVLDDEISSELSDAVRDMISAQVKELARKRGFSLALSYLIKKQLAVKADRNHIYVTLAIHELSILGQKTAAASIIRRAVDEFPQGLTDMFKLVRHRVS